MGAKGKESKSKLEVEFQNLRPKYENLAKEIHFSILQRLKDKGMEITGITYRSKTIESFLEKIERKLYNSPLTEVSDLAGVRVVCLYEPDIQQVAQVIQCEFKVHEMIDKHEDLGMDKMGYQGLHFIVELGSRYSGPRYDNLSGMKCEIQVRTVLQDAWAIISHHLVYKSEASVPMKLRRNLNNITSLLEVAQGVFDNVRDERDNYISKIQEKRSDWNDFISQPVDFDTLAAYTKWKFPNLPISERWHGRMVADLNLAKYQSLQDIDDVVEEAAPAVEVYCQQRPDLFKSGTGFLTKSLGFLDIRQLKNSKPLPVKDSSIW